MKIVYQLILNKVNHDSPLFEKKEEAQKAFAKIRNFFLSKEQDVTVVCDEEDNFCIYWLGGWRGDGEYNLWIREIELGKLPAGFENLQ
jgi:uncharacterized phage-like protein YoqJ